ncbi:MAG TPA: iron chelate uptake ABC transporter family permease subunit, partial [Fibrobacteria bacterium]|nr:iron chelate uptake ABC transporter family permease subunit [Fibrobacteria bacterium]
MKRLFPLLLLSLVAATLAALLTGSSDLSLGDALRALFQGPWRPGVETGIVWQVRAPRVVVVALVGAALSASGTAFQALFRNPMA